MLLPFTVYLIPGLLSPPHTLPQHWQPLGNLSTEFISFSQGSGCPSPREKFERFARVLQKLGHWQHADKKQEFEASLVAQW